jgi:hypothetical protein
MYEDKLAKNYLLSPTKIRQLTLPQFNLEIIFTMISPDYSYAIAVFFFVLV